MTMRDIFALCCFLPATALAGPPESVALVKEVAERVAAQRQLPLLAPVPAALFSQEELRAHMRESLTDTYAPEAAAADAALLHLLGFTEPGTDLFAIYLDLLSEQVGGFYDADTRALFLVRRDEDEPYREPLVLEHELIHALQDQSFDLTAIDRLELDNSDVDTAIRSLIEGDATYFNVRVMTGDTLAGMGPLPLGNGGARVDAEPGTVLAQAPDLISRSLVFPYLQGAEFVQHLYRNDGYRAVNRAFRSHPPLSTEQILHPERYLRPAPDWPVALSLPDDSAPSGATLLDEDTLGELGVLSWLETVGQLDLVGEPLGWGGDRYRVYALPRGGEALVWMTTWDGPAEAERFEHRARHTLLPTATGRWRADGSLRHSEVRATVRRDGTDVVVIVGLSRREAGHLARATLRSTERSLFSSAAVFSDRPRDP